MISIHKQNPTVAGQSSEHFPEQIDGTDNQSQMTVSSQSVIPSVSHKSCSNAGPLQGSMRKGAATATATATLVHDVTASSLPTAETRTARDTTPVSSAHHPQNPKWSGEGPTLKCTYEQTNKRFDQQLSKKTRTTTSVLKHKNNLKSPATRKNPYARPPPSASISKKDNSINQIKRQLPILPDYTTLFPKNNISTTTDQKSLGQPSCLNADATTSLLSVQMNNLGITNAPSLQPQASHSEKVTELQRVDDGENSHGDSHDRPAPTSPQSNFLFGSIDRPKQTTDVSRKGTEEIVYTNLTDLTDKQLEPGHVGASASNHEVLDPMGTTPSSISDLESDASGLSWITSFLGDTTSGEPNIDVFDDFSESTDIDDFQLENGGSRGGQPHKGWSLGGSSSSLIGEQSYFTGQPTLDDAYQNRVFSFEELDSIPRMEINSQQETAVVAGPRAEGFTEGSDHYNTSSDVNASSSGICSDDGDLVSSDQSNSENLSQDQLIRTETKQDFKPKIRPERVPFYQGAPVFLVTFEHPPPSEVQSLRAKFESLGDVLLRKRLNDYTFLGERMPAASRPCIVKVSLESESGRPLGETEVEYFEDPKIYSLLLRHMASIWDGSGGHAHGDTSNSANGESSNGNIQGDTGSSGNGGFTQQLQSLQHLVNAAVESGALWFLEPIFKSTTGRMLLHSYKETSQLPEVIAKKNGHGETAKFLADITKRLSEETEFFPDDVQKIDWSELVFLVERAAEQKIGGIVVNQENYQAENDLTIDTGYFGDDETSSGNLSPQSKSDSDDNSSEISFEDSSEEDETQPKTGAFKKYCDEKPDLPSPDLSDVNFLKEGKSPPHYVKCRFAGEWYSVITT
ncbi:hypothetical protein ABFA07_016610 [Porites harrisoni]